jgi:hypothetical protein
MVAERRGDVEERQADGGPGEAGVQSDTSASSAASLTGSGRRGSGRPARASAVAPAGAADASAHFKALMRGGRYPVAGQEPAKMGHSSRPESSNPAASGESLSPTSRPVV